MSPRQHHDRPDLVGEHALGDAGQLISFIIFALVWVIDGFIFQKTTFLNDVVPLYVRLPLAAAALILSLYLVGKSMSAIFGKERAEPEIITKGVYGIIRHPMYVSEILLYVAFLCFNLSIAAAGVLCFILVFLYAICRYEEALLTAHFGEAYRNYMKKVPMWFPKLFKKGQNA